MEKTELMKRYEQETGEILDMSVLSGDATCSWYRYIGAIEAENQKLRDDASEVFIRDMQFHGGFLSLEAETSLGRVYAEYASHILEENKAQNFVTCELKAGNSEQMFYLTIGRCDGKTVQEKYIEVCNEKASLEAKAAAYDRLMSMNSISENDIQIVLDGNAWCAYRIPFRNLQEDNAGFGATPQIALTALLESELHADGRISDDYL